MQTEAALLETQGHPFRLTTLTVSEPAPDEVVIKIAGVGVCHTDVAVQHGHLPFSLPGVLGHEGSGVVVAVGSDVTKVRIGDRVAATFNSCGECPPCASGRPAYCFDFMGRNLGGARADGSTPLSNDGQPVGAYFFGQSSFGTHAVTRERNIVPVPADVDLEIVGPLGCGVQTGAGAVMNSLEVTPGSSVLITGGGPVGLSAAMAAVVQAAGVIIVVEPIAARRTLALELGATHVIDPADGDLAEQVRAIVPAGVDFALDTTALLPVLNGVVASLGQRGTLGMVGVPADPAASMSFSLMEMQVRGLTYRGIVEGDSDPDEFIPRLLRLHREGRFPFDRLITKAPFAEINEAIAAQSRGEAVKVVLVPAS